METKPYNLLVVDDDRSSIEILIALLGGSYNVTPALNGSRALELVGKLSFDLILLDLMMPDMDGFEVARRLKQNPASKDIPIIFITARRDENSIGRAFDIGGADYVTKPFLRKELLARIRTQLKMLSLVRHLERLSSYDQLSGIYNRRKFFELGLQLFAQAGQKLCAIMIDIDNFKRINDHYGHGVGDKVIRIVAQTIQRMLPEDALFGRLGGEEFAILTGCGEEAILKNRIEIFRTEVEKAVIEAPDGGQIGCTISCGVSFNQENFPSLDLLLDDADQALYDAKGEGKNQIKFRL